VPAEEKKWVYATYKLYCIKYLFSRIYVYVQVLEIHWALSPSTTRIRFFGLMKRVCWSGSWNFQFIITQHKIMFSSGEKHDYFVRLIESRCEASAGRNDDRFSVYNFQSLWFQSLFSRSSISRFSWDELDEQIHGFAVSEKRISWAPRKMVELSTSAGLVGLSVCVLWNNRHFKGLMCVC
jgi:hypothetical protein